MEKFNYKEHGIIVDCKISYVDPITKKQHKYKWYSAWYGIIYRCYCKNSKDYKRYGGKGCILSDEFKTASIFKEFYNTNNPTGELHCDKDLKCKKLGLNLYSRETITFLTVSENSREKFTRIDTKGNKNPACKPIEYYSIHPSTRSTFKRMCLRRNFDFEDFIETFYGYYKRPNKGRESIYTYSLKTK